MPALASDPSVKRIVFVISTMESGGAERVAATLCNAWVAKGKDVFLVTMEAPDAVSHYPLSSAIEVYRLNSIRNSASPLTAATRNIARVATLRKTIKSLQPDIVVSFTSNMSSLVLLALRGVRVPVVACERSHPRYIAISKARHKLRDVTHRFADQIVVQSQAVAEWYKSELGLASVVMPNPVDLAAFAPPGARQYRVDSGKLVSIGRLDEWKGHDTIITAFAAIAEQAPGWTLDIYGKGPSEAAFRRQIAAANLENRIALKGVTSNVPGVLAASDIFVFGSRYEGFPNVVVEALASGCPVVATDSPGATSEILGFGEHGVVVPVDDTQAVSRALLELIRDPQRRQKLSVSGRQAIEVLETNKIADRWLKLLQDVRAQFLRVR